MQLISEYNKDIRFLLCGIVKSFKKCLEDNDIEMYLTYNERKPVDAERFIRTFKNKISHPATRRRLSVRPSDVAGTSEMKHPTTSQWNVAKTSQWYVFTMSYWYVVMTSYGDVMTTSHQYVSTTSRTSLK